MSAAPFSIQTVATWADLDANAHMANFAYLARCVDARMAYFNDSGFPVTEFARRQIGPVVRRDELEYFREVVLLEPVTITLALGGLAPDGSRFRLVNEFIGKGGKLAARVKSEGGWLDLQARKLIVPPPDLFAVLSAMPRTADFAELPSSIKP
jgi:acyl-CoA thioester hydrolase